MKTKILIVGPAWVGDMVMAQGLFKFLKHHEPQQEIDVLAPAWSLPLLERMPEVSRSIVMPINHGELALRERWKIGKNLQKENYRQAIVLPNSFKSALIPFFANIPQRTGWRGEMRYGVLNDLRKLDEKKYPLMIEQFMALAGGVKDEKYFPELHTTMESCARALTAHQLTMPTKKVLALCPGAEFGPAKRWPEKYFADVANAKLAEGWDVWIFGSPKDQVVAAEIMQLTHHRCVNLTGKTKLAEAIDLLSLTSMVVSNDSGLMHIAAALKKSIIAVYGPTSAAFTPPLHHDAKIISLQLNCQPCFKRECPLAHHRCMQELTPEKILQVMP